MGKGNNTVLVEENYKLKSSFSSKQTQSIATAIAFLTIPLIFFTLFVIIPVIQAAYFSLFKWNGLGPLTDFRGFQNFYNIFTDKIFFSKALKNNLLIILFSLVIELPFALMIALAIGRKFKGSVIFRSIFFLPFILAEVIAGVIWSFMYNPQLGLQNTFLSKIFPFFSGIEFLGDPNIVFFSIMIVIMWKYFGFHMVIYIAGLQNILDEVEEAAYVDGVTKWQLNWHIILPMLKPTIIMSVFLSIVGALQVFDIVWAMGKGDPVNSAETMITYLYKFGFQRFSLGYGSAVAIVIFLFCVVFNLFYQRTLSKQD
jgi:raffinose/stachyose/melibiose transport system permease protein